MEKDTNVHSDSDYRQEGNQMSRDQPRWMILSFFKEAIFELRPKTRRRQTVTQTWTQRVPQRDYI